MQLHTIQRHNKHKTAQRVGRGGRRGKTSGRGHKGQKARAGHSIRPEARDAIKRIPKRRGEGASGKMHSHTPRPFEVHLGDIETLFAKGETVSPRTLEEKGMDVRRGGRLRCVKILSDGEITTAVTVEGCDISQPARAKLEAAGGVLG